MDNKPIIKADKNCNKCGGNSRCHGFIGGVHVCSCITNQIDIRNSEGKTTRLEKSKDGDGWDLKFGE